ncbi:DUF1838 domain-containing protein [Thalassotalea sp. HSM 43]|uniref:DUF1838 family protein n=1 Tax=Thalassotalea sp. HSM 43 TaxID=2552945 RepID=UPI001081E48D|nr:DUF1838 family protein [Thalassotalea sp. HSM 43]QBY04576.1 DUF1838 domain-containing protein [Thalassotalea sp. HSM 43]
MKTKLLVAGLLATLFAGTGNAADAIDLNTPEGANQAMRKIMCSTQDAEPVIYWWKGKAFSRRMGEKDKHLFNVEGMNVRTCTTVDGGKRGESYKLVTREILLYTDPKTGEPLQKWTNPWTDEELDVIQVTNDPVNQKVRFPRDENGKPYPWTSKFAGEMRQGNWWMTFPVPLFYHNVLGGDYQKQVGGVYHATEMFNFSGDVESLTSADTRTAKVFVGWVRISDWLPWMMMSGREGSIYIHAGGHKVDDFDDMGETMKKYINDVAPLYKTPPPVDDERANETSWSTYKDDVEGAKFTTPRH